MARFKQSSYYFLASIVISAFLLYYLISNIRINELILVLRKIFIPSLTAYVFTYTISIIVRAYRYKLLIASERITLWDLSLVTVVRNLFVDLLPARLGSLSYIYLIVKHFKFPFEIGASTFLICFIFDLLSLTPLLLLAFLGVGLAGTNIPFHTMLVLSVLLFAITLIAILYLQELIALFLKSYNSLLGLCGKRNNKILIYIGDKLELTRKAIMDIKGQGVYLVTFLLSLLLRLLKYGSLYFLLHSLLSSRGYGFSELGFSKFVIGIAGAELSSNLPIHGLAGIGTWPAAWALTFHLLGFDKQIAIISGLGLHLITQVYEYILGISGILFLISKKSAVK